METITSERTMVILPGSVRDGALSRRAAEVVADQLRRRGATVRLIDPAVLDLPLPGRPTTPDVAALQAAVAAADGVVLVTPEYHGSYSSVLKLVIDNLGFPSTLAGRPVALVGVAAGALGAVKALEHLRSVAAHVGALVLPQTVSVARAAETLDEPTTDQRLRALADDLLAFTTAFRPLAA